MALFDTLKQILTPYANKINLHTEEIEELKPVKNDLANITGAKTIDSWNENAYIKTNVSAGSEVNLTPIALNGYRCVVIDCEEGDVFTISVNGQSTPRAWGFVDENSVLLANAPSTTKYENYILKAPTGAKKLILNDKPADGIFSFVSYYGVPVSLRMATMNIDQMQTLNNGVVKLLFKKQTLQNRTAGIIIPSDTVLGTDRIHLYGEYSIEFPDDYEIYIARFWDGWDVKPDSEAYATGWRTKSPIGILAKSSDLYAIFIRRKDGANISLLEADHILIKKVTYDLEELRIKNWVQGTVDSNGAIVERNNRIASKDIMAFPFSGTFKIRLATGYAIGIRSGPRSDAMPTNTYWLLNGDNYTVPDGHNYFRIIMAYFDGYGDPSIEINPEDAEESECSLLWEKTPTVLEGNPEAVKILDAASLEFHDSGINEKRTIIAHTSDVHGDVVRFNRFADFCDSYGIDFAAVTGDLVAYNVEDGFSFLQDAILDHNTQFGVCAGNHDVKGILTDQQAYNNLMLPIAENIGNTTGKMYYYKDLVDQKLRMISLFLYEDGLAASGSRRTATQHMSSEQLAWLCGALKSTPTEYGIMIMMHTIQSSVPPNEEYLDFYQQPLKYSSAGNTALGGDPVFDIVDAFVSRTSINESYAQTGTPSPISVSDDFSGVDSSVEFIAFMVGHFHADAIGYTSKTTNKLLVLNVTCTNSIYGGTDYPYLADVSDLHRNSKGQSQDAFNTYVIDREEKVVHVIRIGANMTYEMKKRQYMKIPYIVNN